MPILKPTLKTINPHSLFLKPLFALALALVACTTTTTTPTEPVQPAGPKTYTVTFDTDGGSAVAAQTVVSGTNAVRPKDNPTRTGYAFDDWYGDQKKSVVFNFNSAITNDLTVYAKWIKLHTVTFNTGGGSAVAPQTITNGDKAKQPPDPNWTGRIFNGWFTSAATNVVFNFGSAITNDLTIYAGWNLKSYTVTFATNSAGAEFTNQVVKHESTVTPLKSEPKRSGFAFDGWFKDSALKQAFNFNTDIITADTTLYAKWIVTYTVSFNTAGGDVIPSQTIGSNRMAKQPGNPSKSGDFFAGWFIKPGTKDKTFKFDFDTVKITSNTTVYAAWTDKGATVIFTNFNGPVVAEQRFAFGEKATRPAKPVSNGYDFIDWYTTQTGGTLFNFGSPINVSNTIVYARWIKTFTVTFATNQGGATVLWPGKSQTVRQGSNAVKPAADPTRGSHNFVDWFTTAATNTKFNFGTGITADTTIYAGWKKKIYTVNFNTGGGSAVAAQTIAHGEKATEPDDPPTRANFDFKGWHADTAGTTPFSFGTVKITSNTVVYAKWQKSVYTVSFTNANGVELAKQSVTALEKATKPTTDPVSNGYSFLGWYTTTNALTAATPTFNFDTPITSSTNLYARWIKTFTVGFATNQGGATVLWPGKSQTVRQGSNAVRSTATPTLTGFTFKGWFTTTATNVVFNFGTGITGDTTIYAAWEQKRYPVTFITNTATPSAPAFTVQRVLHSSNAVAPSPAPTRTGFTFKGWFTTAETNTKFDLASFAITSATNVYASWELNTYTVTFITNTATPSAPAFTVQRVLHSSNTAAPSPAPTRANFIFRGWHADTAGTTPFNFDTVKITSNTAVYAKWLFAFQVTFDTDGGSTVQLVSNNSKVKKPADPTRAGRAFLGWYKDSARITPFDFATERITGNITIYALWGYEVTYHLNGGSLASLGSGTVKKAVTANTNLTFLRGPFPTRSEPSGGGVQRYHFGGWYKDASLSQYFFPELEPVTNNLLLYAKWQGNNGANPPINFDMRGSSPLLWPAVYSVNTQWGAVRKTLPAVSNAAIDATNGNLVVRHWNDKDGNKVADSLTLNSGGPAAVVAWTTLSPAYGPPVIEPDASKGFSLDADNANPAGLAYYNGHFYVGDLVDRKLYAYKATTGARDTSKEVISNLPSIFSLVHVDDSARNRQGFYVGGLDDGVVRFYSNNGGANPSRNINLKGINASYDRVYGLDYKDGFLYVLVRERFANRSALIKFNVSDNTTSRQNTGVIFRGLLVDNQQVFFNQSLTAGWTLVSYSSSDLSRQADKDLTLSHSSITSSPGTDFNLSLTQDDGYYYLLNEPRKRVIAYPKP